MDYLVKDEKVPIFEDDSFFIALPQSNGFQLKVDSIEFCCPDCTVSVSKNQIKFNQPIIFDYANNTMRILTPIFNENRILMKDGSSAVKGFKILDFDSNTILVKNKVTLNSIINEFNISRVTISGDYGFVTFEDGIFEGKDIYIHARGLSKIFLGKSNVKSIEINSQMASVDSSKITKI